MYIILNVYPLEPLSFWKKERSSEVNRQLNIYFFRLSLGKRSFTKHHRCHGDI